MAESRIKFEKMRDAHESLIQRLPLITCVLVPENRPEFALQSLQYFERQDYPERELVVVDDGAADLASRFAADRRVRYLRVPLGLAVEQKREYGSQQARGEVLAFWDDSDWHGAERLSYQAGPILRGDAEASALATTEFMDLDTGAHWNCSPARSPECSSRARTRAPS
jgi:O-antigen biosynthesis protein